MLLPIGTDAATARRRRIPRRRRWRSIRSTSRSTACADFARAGGVEALSARGTRRARRGARVARRCATTRVRRAKDEALALAFERFVADEWGAAHAARVGARRLHRARALVARRLRALSGARRRALAARRWRDWPAPLRDRDPRRSTRRGGTLAREILRQQYLQWIAEIAVAGGARASARAAGVTVVRRPAVHGRRGERRRLGAARASSCSTSRSACRPTRSARPGQDWGLPTYRLGRDRDDRTTRGCGSARAAWPRSSTAIASITSSGSTAPTAGRRPARRSSSPSRRAAQIGRARTSCEISREPAPAIIAEDLGVVPDFVRASLARLGVPGCKVLRWERDWHAPGQPFVDPAAYPAVSAAMTGTHDTEPLAGWWDEARRRTAPRSSRYRRCARPA